MLASRFLSVASACSTMQTFSRGLSCRALVFDQFGEPQDVLQQRETSVNGPGAGQILVQMLQSPINPSDINTVQGKYPIQPQVPNAIPGHEGVGRVMAVGPQVTVSINEGDLVVPFEPGQGTWRQRGVFAADMWHPVPKNLPVDQAATLVVNPCTALGLLENYVDLKPGDVVLQNAGTSAVAQLVSQIARAKGIKCVSVVRQRPDMEDTVSRLKAQGADLVTTDEKLRDDLKAAKLGPPPRLALNCVGGASALALAKALGQSGVMVTYGGMSMQPVTIPTSLLIFKDLTFKGYWLSGREAQQQGRAGRAAVMDKLAHMIIDGKLHTSTVTYPMSKYQEALAAASTPHKASKVLLDFTDPAARKL